MNIVLVVLLGLKGVAGTDPFIEDLKVPQSANGEFCGYEKCQRVKSDALNVHIVPTSHAELGYDKQFGEYFTGDDSSQFYPNSKINWKRILDSTISELWANSERRFTLSELPYFFYWWSKRDGTVRRMVYELVRQGRLVFVGGGWGLNDETVTNYQAIIDSFTYGLRKLNDTFGTCGRPLVAWQVESYGHSREMASLLATMGYDAAFISPISFDDEIARMNNKAYDMLWRGSDDLGVKSDIFTNKLFDDHRSPPGFCFDNRCPADDALLLDSDDTFSNIEDRVRDFVRVSYYRQAPYFRTRNILVVMGTKHAYYDARKWFVNIEKLMTHVANTALNHGIRLNLFYSTPACYLRAVYNANPRLPIKQDDFLPYAQDLPNYYTGIYTSRPALKYMIKVGNVFFQIAKQLELTAGLGWNGYILEEMKWIMGLVQDHNIITGAHRQYVSNYYGEKLSAATQKASIIMRQAFNKIRGSSSNTTYYRCYFNISACRNTNSEKYYVIIYNPLAWPVSLPVRLPVRSADFVVFNVKGKPVETRIHPITPHILEIPVRFTNADRELVFMADDVPPLGFTSYFIQLYSKKKRVPKSTKLNNTKNNKKIQNLDKRKKPIKPENRKRNSLGIETSTIAIEKLFNNSIPNKPTQNISTRNFYSRTTQMTTGRVTTVHFEEPDIAELVRDIANSIPKQENDESEEIPIQVDDTARRTIAKSTQKQADESVTVRDIAEATPSQDDDFGSVEDDEEDLTDVVLEIDNIYTSSNMTRNNIYPNATEAELIKNDLIIYHFETRIADATQPANISPYKHIKNKYIRVNLDPDGNKIGSVKLVNGIEIYLDIQVCYYEAYINKQDPAGKLSSGPYVFKPMRDQAIRIVDKVKPKIYVSSIVEEIHLVYSYFASIVVRLYTDLPYIEVDWVIGPIPVDDDVGKDIIIRYITDLRSGTIFYTDSNGRQTIKRRLNERGSYNYENPKPIVGNYYPVTSKIYIEDKTRNVKFAVLNDRPQGGSSLRQGEVELMVHRRLLSEENNVRMVLNETEGGNGVIVRGKHYIYISTADKIASKVYEKKLAKEILLPPQIMVSAKDISIDLKQFTKFNNQFSALKMKLPLGIHLLTLEPWQERTFLLRLENYLEKCDVGNSKTRKVNLSGLFENLRIIDIRETSLGANIWKEDAVPLQWQKESQFVTSFNEHYGNPGEADYIKDEIYEESVDDWQTGIKLDPMEIKTFIVYYSFKK